MGDKIIGEDSAYKEAIKKRVENMMIAANLIDEVSERIVELEQEVECEERRFNDLLDMYAELSKENDRLRNILKPMDEYVRKMLEIETVMPTLLNGGSKGAERVAQLVVEWHEAEKRTAERCAEICKSLSYRDDDMGAIIACCISKEFGLEE